MIGQASQRRALLVAAMTLVTGCLSPRSDPSQFFILTPMNGPGVSAGDALSGLAVGIGPVSFPAYLDRPQMVTRLGPNQVELSEADRWAASLQENFTHALATNIALLLGSDRVVTYPWYSSVELDYTVSVNVLQFEREPSGAATLKVRWGISDVSMAQGAGVRETSLTEQAESPATAASVAALSRGVEAVSRAIVEAIGARARRR